LLKPSMRLFNVNSWKKSRLISTKKETSSRRKSRESRKRRGAWHKSVFGSSRRSRTYSKRRKISRKSSIIGSSAKLMKRISRKSRRSEYRTYR